MAPRQTVLVVDDDLAVGKVLTGLLSQAGYEARFAPSAEKALTFVAGEAIDLVITDLKMPGMDGSALLRELKKEYSELPVIMLTAHGTVPLAVQAMREGAQDFVLKPFERDALLASVERALAFADRSTSTDETSKIVATSGRMKSVLDLIDKAARSSATVLIRGESGTGKEVAARAIHERGHRREHPFVKVHCAGLPENLLESELFGYEKGAFTGATMRKPGRVELAESGTLFLDEIGDISSAVQVKLLRILQDRQFERVGGTETLTADVRFIAATHRDLESMTKAGSFREDLFYRLNVIPIFMPPLRERKEEVAPLARAFFERAAEQNQRPELRLDASAISALEAEVWSGNVRQLLNIVERLVVLSDGPSITRADVDRELGREPAKSSAPQTSELTGNETLDERRRDTEKTALIDALERSHQNRTLAARVLGVSRRTLYNKMKELGIE